MYSIAVGEVLDWPLGDRCHAKPQASPSGKVSCSGSQSSRVVINTSRATLNPSLELTTLCTGGDSSYTAGSTASGDSFVLNIDWTADELHVKDESFVDPYLTPKESRDDRRRRETMKREAGTLKDKDQLHRTSEHTPVTLASTLSPISCFPPVQTSSTKSRSLGSFTFPKHLNFPAPSAFIAQDEVSIDSCDENDYVEPSQMRETLAEVNRCRALLDYTSESTLARAEAMLDLGKLQVEADLTDDALRSFLGAARLFRRLKKPLALATCLDNAGVTCSRGGAHQVKAGLKYLEEALTLRHSELGPWHVDTVDSMNHIACLHKTANNLSEARRCFWEVFWVRRAIFGSGHPSVAVCAHDLANTFCSAGSLEDASNFYAIAMEIYDNMNLPRQNPAVSRLMRDMKRLERVERWEEA